MTSWTIPPPRLTVTHDEVHVWRAALDAGVAHLETLRSTLAPDELAREKEFHFREHRQRFVIARGLLRAILAGYLDLEPAALQLRYNGYGKPSLLDAAGDRLRFNASHSNQLVVFAVTRGREVGVDIEYISARRIRSDIAERFFSTREVSALRALPVEEQREAFFSCWTCKEAYLKAIGHGLSFPLDQFDVLIDSGSQAVLMNVEGHPHEAQRWSLQKLIPGAGYVGALAVEGKDWRLRSFDWIRPLER